jgi:pimeloyl-ACP methyl ester carboxylesterase
LTLDLAGQTSRITAPTLIVAGKLDRLIPWQQAAQVASEIPDSELLMLEDGNHGNMNVWPKHRPYTADWLAQKLGASSGGVEVA